MLRLSIRRRLQLGLLAIGIALALFAAGGFTAVSRLGTAIATILTENYASVVACEDMKNALARQDSIALFATGDEPDVRPLLVSPRADFDRAFAREAANVTLPGEGDSVEKIRAQYKDYIASVDATLLSLDKMRLAAGVPGERGRLYTTALSPRFVGLNGRIQTVLDMNQQAMVDADRDAKSLARRTKEGALAASALVALLAAFLAVWLPRVIVRPVLALTAAAEAIGEGDFAGAVAEPAVAELIPLARAFSTMREKLQAYRESSLGELLAAKDLARATLECMPEPVVVFGASRAVRYANSAAEAAFGLRAGDPDDPPDVFPALAAARDAVLETGEPVLPKSLAEAVRFRTKEGERDYLVRALPLKPAAHEPTSAIVVAQEVTRLRRIDELKSDMVATVSHQFKTPLTSLRMATHLLLEPSLGELAPSQRELVVTARDETERLRAMVEDLLDVVRIESGAGELRRVPTAPHAFLHDVAEAHRSIAKDAGITLEVEPPPPDEPWVEIDPERLGIAVANLVSNAIRHTRTGGSVRLSAKTSDESLILQVTDVGEGMTKDRLAGLFDRASSSAPPSVRPRATSSGAPTAVARQGLGLTIAREIVLQHGGELTADSEPGKGSTFTVTLPRG